jgi:putative membrane protein
MKAISYVLVAGAMMIGSACSSTKTGAATETAAGGSTATTSTGSDMNPSTSSNAGADATGTDAGSSNAAGVTSSATGAGSGGADAAADPTAFMATFATMQDPVFLMNAASSNMLEIKAGQMASQKATNSEVRKYAQMMVSHHTSSTQELKAIGMPLGVKMPTTMMPVHQAMADRLQNKSGKAFDEAYMDMMETAHKMDIAMFEVKSKAAETPNVQQFATKTLPMLRSHSTMADGIEKKAD